MAADELLHFPSTPPVPPADAEKTFEALHGFKMQLIAAEPLVCDPVAITYDEDGRAFVCEMSDYPYTDKAHHKPSQENPTDQAIGKVRLLVDTDGDGVFDKATVFADGLSWPTGSACWKGGIIVVATPDIWYLKDTDGDGVADVRQKLFTGLKKLNVQAVANNPIWGLDNKIYIAGGSNGGTLQNLVHPEEKPITFRRNDLILDPVKMTIELASGGARFGNTRDDWGNRFLCNIRNPLEHVVIEQRYLARNPYMPPVNPLNDVAESGDQLPVYRISPPEAWREFRAKRWTGDSTVASHMPRSELVGSGVVTSSSGCTIYRGDAYPKKFYGNAFVADVAGNLFYRLALTPDGVTFKGTRVDGKKEMVASRDLWFRPVNFANAPDGTLTVCDMYREVIEHPWSLPDDIHAALDLERGRDKGRLYRLSPPGFKGRANGGADIPVGQSSPPDPNTPARMPALPASFKAPQLSKANTAELVALLAHPNAWHRDTAHRLLFERQDQTAVPLLREIVQKNAKPLARVEAMWVLLGLNFLSDDLLSDALSATEESARAQGVQLALLKQKPSEHLIADVDNLCGDPSIRVRFKTALFLNSIGEMPNGPLAAPPGLVKIAARDGNDAWMRAAISSSDRSALDTFLGLMDGLGSWNGSAPDILGDLARTVVKLQISVVKNAGGTRQQDKKAGDLLPSAMMFHALIRGKKLDELDKRKIALAIGEELSSSGSNLFDLAKKEDERSWLNSWLNESTKSCLIASFEPARRESAIRSLFVLAEISKIDWVAAKLLQPSEPDAIRVATIKLLGQQRDAKVADLLLEAWPTLTPAPREATLQAMIGRPQLVEALLSAVEQARIKPAEISATARTLLSKNANAKVRERTTKLFGGSGSRAEAIAKYQSALTLKGDAMAGHKVYQTICAACHRKGDEGRDIGPNLATIMSWTSEQMLTNILDPNREVSPNFLLYIVETNDGRTLSGLITSETPTSVALKGADGVEQSVARSEVKSLKSAGISLMPEGLEATITVQQMADLMAFLKS